MEKLTLKDRKILYELDLNSRQPNSQLARKVALSEQLVGYKIRQLIKREILTSFITAINPSLLGYSHFKVFLRLQKATPAKEKEILDYLTHHKNTFWVVSTRGRYDLIVSFYAQSITEFSQIFRDFSNKYSEFILDRNIVLLESAKSYTRAYLLENKEPQELKYGGVYPKVELDEEDKAILSLISQHARLQNLELAQKLKVSPDKIRYRLKKLQERGLITGFRIRLDFKKLSLQYHLITFNLLNLSPEKQKEFASFARYHKNVIHYINCIGNHEMEFEIETACPEDFDKLLREIRDKFSTEIKDYEIIEVLKEHKMDYYPF